MTISRWWRARTGLERFDLVTRWSLYAISASVPLLVLLVTGGQPAIGVWWTAALFLVTVAQTVVCTVMLRTAVAHSLGGPRPTRGVLGVGLALTAAAVGVGLAAFPAPDQAPADAALPAAVAVAMVFVCALTAAATPLLRARTLVAAVVLPAGVAAGWQAATASPAGSPSWALGYVVFASAFVLTYRLSVWYLHVVWEIDRSRDAQARLAVAEERLRFTRDLHDVLGRNLALIALNSELAAQFVRRGKDGAVEHMLAARQIAQDSMREVREVVGGYRSADLVSELAGARSVLQSAGISTRVIGDVANLPPSAQAALGWAVREATTNIIRHADSTAVKIEVDVTRDADSTAVAVMVVENDGVRVPDPADETGTGKGAGTGLAGLRARLAGLGGEVTATSLPGSRFRVQVRLPLTSPVPAPTGPLP